MTPYMKFHPGGVDELMRGAGKDCTILFDEVRPLTLLQPVQLLPVYAHSEHTTIFLANICGYFSNTIIVL